MKKRSNQVAGARNVLIFLLLQPSIGVLADELAGLGGQAVPAQSDAPGVVAATVADGAGSSRSTS